MNKKIIVGFVAILVIATLGLYLPRGNTVVQRVVGAVSTLDGVDSPYVSINGLSEYYYRQAMTATSSVPCSVQNPYKATSTLDFYSVQVNSNGIAVAQIVDVSTSTTAYASSTPAFVKGFSVGAGQFSIRWTANATTTSTQVIGMKVLDNAGVSDVFLGPSEYINFRISTTTAGTFSSYWTGTCQAKIRKL